MQLDRACTADPAHKSFKRFHTGFRPVVLSSDRFNGIVSRAQQQERQELQAALEEEQRYKQYLQDGNAALLKRFTNMYDTWVQDEDEVQATKDNELAARAKDRKAQQLLDEMRKERIIRANKISNLMKPGPRALQQALLKSEMFFQLNNQLAMKREIASAAERQQRLDEQLCPPLLVPFGHVTEQQEQAQQQAKANAMREFYVQDLEARRLRKLHEREAALHEGIVEREQYKCLLEREQKAAKERAEQKREFCRRAYRESLEDKAATAKFESICDQIEDRIVCVDQTTKRSLNARYNKQTRDQRDERTRALEAHAMQLCRKQQAVRQQLQERQQEDVERGDFEERVDDMRRRCDKWLLAHQRREYELKARQCSDEQRQATAEIRRFEMATRFKNADANKKFAAVAKKREDAVTAELREALHGQRKQALEQRQDELMRITACDEDPYLEDDVKFFEGAVQTMKECQELGRPLYPIAKAVNIYRRDNQVDMVPEGQMVCRSKRRDKCWPGFFSKAELAYRKYEHRERCRREQEKERHQIFDNCIKITKMASEESPYRPCAKEFPMRLIQHRGIPQLSPVNSADLPGFTCWAEDLPPPKCPSINQADTPGNANGSPCPSVMGVMQPGEEYPASEARTASLTGGNPKPDAKSEAATTVAKAESATALAAGGSKRASGGREPSTATGGKHNIKTTVGRNLSVARRSTISRTTITSNRQAANPDLTRYWTAKPQVQVKAEIAPLNYPIISSIDSHRNGKTARSGNRKYFL